MPKMNFLQSIFGRNKPTTETAFAALARVEAELAAAPARIAAAKAALVDIAGMSDSDHAAAIAERDAASRSADRLKAQVGQLQNALVEAKKSEEAAALSARAKAASAALSAYAGLIDQHHAQAAALAAILAEMAEVEREIAAVNAAIDAARRAGLQVPAKIETPDERYRREPDVVTPERTVVEDRVQYYNGRHYVDVGVTVRKEGRLILGPGESVRKVEKTIPASTKSGRRCCSPTSETVIAPARVGQARFWPRAG